MVLHNRHHESILKLLSRGIHGIDKIKRYSACRCSLLSCVMLKTTGTLLKPSAFFQEEILCEILWIQKISNKMFDRYGKVKDK
jgi:hypothetical protein